VQPLLVAQQRPRDRVLLHLLYAAGLRVSEACQLRWRNLRTNGDAGQITVFGKKGRIRWPHSVRSAAITWLVGVDGSAGADEPVFQSRSGKILDRGRVRTIVRQAAAQAGVRGVSPHWLRHAHASHALDRGAPLYLRL